MQSLMKRREITCILTVYVDDILINRNLRRNHESKKISEREIPDHRCRWSQFYYWSKIWKNAKMIIYYIKKKYTKDILKKFNIEKYIPSSNIIPMENEEMRKKKYSSTRYRKAIGSFIVSRYLYNDPKYYS